MSGKTKMVNVHVVPYRLHWAIKVNGKRVGTFLLQADADDVATMLARLFPAATLKLHDRRGRIRPGGERTFPRSRDPKKTPG